MNTRNQKALLLGAAFALAFPAMQALSIQEAEAQPMRTISKSRKGGERSHKQKSKKKSKKSSSSSRSSSSHRSSTTTHRTTTRRPPATHRTTTTTRRADDRHNVRHHPSHSSRTTTHRTTTRRPSSARPVERRTTTTHTRNGRTVSSRTTTSRPRPTTTHRRTTTTSTHRHHPHSTSRRTTTTSRHPHSSSRRTTTTTRKKTVHHRSSPSRVTVHHHSPPPRTTTSRTTVHHHHRTPPASRNTTVHHYHNQRTPPTSTVQSSSSSNNGRIGGREKNLYVTGGMGVSGFAAPQIADLPLPGLDFNLGFGGKRGIIGAEMGFGLAGWRFDPSAPSRTANLTMYSMTGDLKLQPSFSFFEPYIFGGMGGHVFNDHYIDETAVGASVRMGGGVDLRFNNVALNAQYMRSFLGMVGDADVYEDGILGASTETLGMGLKIYF